MCNNNCKCETCVCKPRTTIPVLQVGKTYELPLGTRIKIVAVDDGVFIGRPVRENRTGNLSGEVYAYIVDGTALGNHQSIFNEYKEPVIHKRDIVWFNRGGFIMCYLASVGQRINWPELKRQTITFEEK